MAGDAMGNGRRCAGATPGPAPLAAPPAPLGSATLAGAEMAGFSGDAIGIAAQGGVHGL